MFYFLFSISPHTLLLGSIDAYASVHSLVLVRELSSLLSSLLYISKNAD
jgi:hypothetical protein